VARRSRAPGTSQRRVLLPDDQLLDEYRKWVAWRIFGRGWPPPPPPRVTTEELRAALEEVALAHARRRDTRRIGRLLETGQLSPQGMATLIDLLKTNFPRPVGGLAGERMDTGVGRAAGELPAMVEFLTECHPELTPAFRMHGIPLVAKLHGVLEETVRNRVDRGRRRNRV
jgi:hypothetical protein